jgi:hypothetical protein
MGELVIDSRMNVCDCCDMCDCIGPTVTTDVFVGPLPVGRRVIRAGDMTCTIDVIDAGVCSPQPTEEVRMPRSIFVDQDLPMSLISRGSSGCGCTPRVGGDIGGIEMEVCACCEDCRCIDPGYEAGDVRPALAPGEHVVNVGGMPRNLSVVGREACRPASPAGIRIEQPTDLIHGGPALTWVVLEGRSTECCVDPAFTVESRRSFEWIELSAYDCTPLVDCDCVPIEPYPFEAWHSLGELGPGTYNVSLGSEIVTFTID